MPMQVHKRGANEKCELTTRNEDFTVLSVKKRSWEHAEKQKSDTRTLGHSLTTNFTIVRAHSSRNDPL